MLTMVWVWSLKLYAGSRSPGQDIALHNGAACTSCMARVAPSAPKGRLLMISTSNVSTHLPYSPLSDGSTSRIAMDRSLPENAQSESSDLEKAKLSVSHTGIDLEARVDAPTKCTLYQTL